MAGYAPRSPDLSGASYAPRSPDLSGASYAPRSPDLSSYTAPSQDVPVPLLSAQSSVDPGAFSQPFLSVPPTQQYPISSSPAAKPRARKISSQDDAAYSPPPKGPGRGRGRKKQKVEEEVEELNSKLAPGIKEGIEVKTKFPVARIKRIMQHDEEVGKVAQVTPTAVSKALELFMISIVSKAADKARIKGSKKVTVSHMKQVVATEQEFDFLSGVCEKYSDTSASKGKRGKKESEEDDADD